MSCRSASSGSPWLRAASRSSSAVIPWFATVPAGAPSMGATLALEDPAVEVGEPEQDRDQAYADDRERPPERHARAGHVPVAHRDEPEHQPEREEDHHADGCGDGEHDRRLAVAPARKVALLRCDAAEAAHALRLPRTAIGQTTGIEGVVRAGVAEKLVAMRQILRPRPCERPLHRCRWTPEREARAAEISLARAAS